MFRPLRALPPVLTLLLLHGAAAGQEVSPAPAGQEALVRGQAWLVSRQSQEGSWAGSVGYRLDYRYMGHDETPHVGITALAGLALIQAADPAAEVACGVAVGKAVKWLSGLGDSNYYGYISRHGTRFQEHCLATQFLAEVHRRRPGGDLESVLVHAVGLIVRSQDETGGWRYQPQAYDNDLIVTATAMHALRAAGAAGVAVPDEIVHQGMKYIRKCQALSDPGEYFYQPSTRSRRTYTCTALGVSAQLAWDPAGISALPDSLRQLKSASKAPSWGGLDCLLGRYHALLVLRWSQTDGLEQHAADLGKLILSNRRADGTWDDEIGPVYATAMSCLILQECK